MIRIAVVDDEPLIIDMISEKVSDILNKHKINYEVLTFTDGKSLIKSFEWHRKCQYSGTAQTVRMAQKKNIMIINLFK